VHQAKVSFARGAEIYAELGLAAPGCHLELSRGWACVRQGDFGEGQKLAKHCLEKARELEDEVLLQDALHLLGVAESVVDNRSKNFLRSIDALREALAQTKAAHRVLATRWILLSLARLYGERGSDDLSRKFAEEERELVARIRPRVQDVFWDSYRDEARERVLLNEGRHPHSVAGIWSVSREERTEKK
jgi:tetratricopeptide (TPR) repeat protein